MHKVKNKKANITIETNKPISWIKSSINDGLNNSQINWVKLTPMYYFTQPKLGCF